VKNIEKRIFGWPIVQQKASIEWLQDFVLGCCRIFVNSTMRASSSETFIGIRVLRLLMLILQCVLDVKIVPAFVNASRSNCMQPVDTGGAAISRHAHARCSTLRHPR